MHRPVLQITPSLDSFGPIMIKSGFSIKTIPLACLKVNEELINQGDLIQQIDAEKIVEEDSIENKIIPHLVMKKLDKVKDNPTPKPVIRQKPSVPQPKPVPTTVPVKLRSDSKAVVPKELPNLATNMKIKLSSQTLKIKQLNEQIRRRDIKVKKLQAVINDLQMKSNVLNKSTESLSKLKPEDTETLKQSYPTEVNPRKRYTEQIRKFALTVNYLSPKAYEFIRTTYKSSLPPRRVLRKWYQHANVDDTSKVQMLRCIWSSDIKKDTDGVVVAGPHDKVVGSNLVVHQ